MKRLLALLAVTAACSDSSVTAVEISASLPTGQGVDQLRIGGAIDGETAFEPGVLPAVPRLLDAHETAMVVLPDNQDGRILEVSVDAMVNGLMWKSATGSVMIEKGSTEVIEVDFDGSAPGPDGGMDGGNQPTEIAGLTMFDVLHANNPKVVADVTGVFLGSTITVVLPAAADEKMVVPTFTTATAGSIVSVGSAVQTSGSTKNDFSSSLAYHVSTPAGMTRDYAVSVTNVPGDKGTMKAFGFAASENPQLTVDAVGTLGSNTVTVHVPAGINPSALVPRFAILGAAQVGGVDQTSGVTAANFSSPQAYIVTTAKGSSTWTVTVVADQ